MMCSLRALAWLLIALLTLGSAAGAAEIAAGYDEAGWKAWRAAHEADYAADRLAVLKAAASVYLKPGQTAYLTGEPKDPASYRLSLERPGSSVLSVRYADGKALLARGGEILDLLALMQDVPRYPVNDAIDVMAKTSGEGTDDPRLVLIIFNQHRKEAKTFEGLRFFPFAPAFVTEAAFAELPAPKPVPIETERGLVKRFFLMGHAEFTLEDKAIRMPIYSLTGEPGEIKYLFAAFTDETTGRETYGVGRYLDLKEFGPYPPAKLTIDFNRAYNPLCARSRHYNCPLVEFHIPLAVRAGERTAEKAGKSQ